jgi:hypothetical protein
MCPCCLKLKETSTHLLNCLSNLAFMKSLDTLQTSLCNSHAHPVRHLLIQGIKHWSRHKDYSIPDISKFPPHLEEPIRTALQSQRAIGWEQVKKCCLSKQWMELSMMISMKPGRKDDVSQGEQTMKQCILAINDHTTRL